MAKNDYWLRPGEGLNRGESIVRGADRLQLQPDGNLVLVRGGKAAWASGTKSATRFQVNPDGQAVLLAGATPVWSTRTGGNPGSQLNLSGDGRFIVYKPAAGGKFTPIWDSRRQKPAAGYPSKGAITLPDPMKILKDAGSAVSNLAQGKVKKSVQALGAGVNQITGSALIQAAFPVVAPANIINGAVTGGKAGAIKAAQSFLKNPTAKATYSAVGLIFPPLAPVSAGAVAGMEAASRVLDGIEAKDPKAIASAALQFAATQALASDGNPGAKRALDYIEKTSKARGIADLMMAGDHEAQAAAATLKKQAASGDKAAQAANHLLSSVLVRQSAKKGSPQKPAIHGAARSEAPNLLAQVHAAMTSPAGLRIGDFSVLRTGRVLHKGKAIPHSSAHKSSKKAAPAHHAATAHLPR